MHTSAKSPSAEVFRKTKQIELITFSHCWLK